MRAVKRLFDISVSLVGLLGLASLAVCEAREGHRDLGCVIEQTGRLMKRARQDKYARD